MTCLAATSQWLKVDRGEEASISSETPNAVFHWCWQEEKAVFRWSFRVGVRLTLYACLPVREKWSPMRGGHVMSSRGTCPPFCLNELLARCCGDWCRCSLPSSVPWVGGVGLCRTHPTASRSPSSVSQSKASSKHVLVGDGVRA